jgi:hypothetical protein
MTLMRIAAVVFAALVTALVWTPPGRAAGGSSNAGSNLQSFQKIIPGRSTKSDVTNLFGAPWRIVQFNDCGMAMDDQADETWEYRDATPGKERIQVEFDDNGVVHLIARIPNNSSGANASQVKVAPENAMNDAM